MSTYNIHAGHNKIVPGASGILDEVTEDRKVKNGIISRLRTEGHTAYDCTDDKGKTQGANLANIVAKCNKHSVDIDVSIHLNSGRKDKKGDGKTGGTEVFIWNDDLKDIAKAVADAISEEFGYALRSDSTTPSGCAGVKITKSLYVLNNTKAPAMLIETCFVDDADDAKMWDADKCAEAIVKGLTGKVVSSGSSKPSGGSTKPSGGTTGGSGYYPAFSSSSIVDGLKSIGVDSSMSNRKKIASANGISNYQGTTSQNTKLCSLAKQGKLKKPGNSSGGGSSSSYYTKFNSTSIVDGLKSIGVDSSFSNRKKIAAANGISNYQGSASQNNKLCSLAKQGKLKKA